MSNTNGFQQALQSIQQIPGQVIRFISSAVAKIFSPTEDNYPKTGVQPYHGDPPKEE